MSAEIKTTARCLFKENIPKLANFAVCVYKVLADFSKSQKVAPAAPICCLIIYSTSASHDGSSVFFYNILKFKKCCTHAKSSLLDVANK